MIQLFRKSGLFILPVIIVIVIINLVSDPSHLFANGAYEEELAKAMLLGKNLANALNYDVRLFQKYYIRGLTEKKEVIVLGSSRSLTVKSKLFTSKTFFNNSINGAGIDDYRYVYQLYREMNLLPRVVIIGLDPWILNKNKYGQGAATNAKPFTFMTKTVLNYVNRVFRTTINQEGIVRYSQLFSPNYFQASLSTLFKKIQNKNDTSKYISIEDSNDPQIDRYSDGSMNLEKNYTDSPDEIRKRALNYDPKPLLGDFYKLDETSILNLEGLIEDLQKDGVQIIFYLPPYHPLTYNNLVNSQKYKILLDVQNCFEILAREKGIKIYGSYNPKDYLLEESDFYDGTHPREIAVEKIFNHEKIQLQ